METAIVLYGIYRGCIGIMEKEMETTIALWNHSSSSPC